MDKIYTEKHQINRHEFIQMEKHYLNPFQINVAVDLAMKKAPSILPPVSQNPIYVKLDTLEPMKFGMDFDKNRARLAFGSAGLIKIIHDIDSVCVPVINQSLLVLIDLMYDPLEYNRAVQQMHVIKRIEDVFYKCIPERAYTLRTIELCMKNFDVIASQYTGAEKIMKQNNLVDIFYEMIIKHSALATVAASILSKLSSYRLIGEEMLHFDHLKKLKHVFNTTPESHNYEHLYIHLNNLILLNPMIGIDVGYFEVLITKLGPDSLHLNIIIKTLACLLDCAEGHKRFDEIDGIQYLYDLSSYETGDAKLMEYLALGIMNCTFSKTGIWRCREFWNLPNLLVKWTYVKDNANLQAYALQTLRQITSLPCIKNIVRRTLKEKIIKIQCQNDHTNYLKKKLIDWLRKKVYINIDCDNVNDDDDGILSTDSEQIDSNDNESD